MYSKRNKTINICPEDVPELCAKCAVPDVFDENAVGNMILNGDLFDVAPRLPARIFDLVIADPPYNLTKNYGGCIFSKTDDKAYAEFTERWIAEVKRLMKPTGTVYVCCDWQSGMIIGEILKKHFKIRNRITWQREKGRGAAKNWKNSMEDIWFCTVGDEYTFNLDAVKVRRKVIAPYRENGKAKDWEETDGEKTRLTCPSNFWDDITVPFWSMAENTAHPTQKPEKLYAKLILASSHEDDLIFDPFGGSGTAAVTAKKLGRRAVAVEKNLQYCVWGQLRLQRAEEDNSIQGIKNGVFSQRNE